MFRMGIQKIAVAEGMFWVEIPAADLRILCGCPGDSVKTLIKRGLIIPKESKGVKFETGPNAILLSDLPVQNGEFANLSEFPVLQMLYRQGMFLPGHPNNTGSKPILIGAEEQVQCQLNYIHRGNYGLVSREEIMQTGITEPEAAEMMRLKLKFAFGAIQNPTDFVETRIVGDGPIEIGNGVSVCRLKKNVFEFSYLSETETVDLNLAPGVQYSSAYQLGFHRFESDYFSVIHSGDGDGWDPNRPAMSSIITHQGNLYLIDAGPNLSNILSSLGIGIDQVDGIFHTHAHDDHFAGLTALMRAGRRIKYYATPLVRQSVSKKLASLIGIEGLFYDCFDVQPLSFDQWTNVDGLEVMPIFSPHPVETNILAFRSLYRDGYRSYAHYADIVSLTVLERMVTDDPAKPGLSRAFFDRVRKTYVTPYDLKKIDVGGGLIHGDAKDFIEDKSTRILLSHRASSLTTDEKEIGSSAAFGSVDILISGQSDALRRHAYAYLDDHLPGVPSFYLRTLLNNPIVEINPGSLIVKEGDALDEMLLILSGQVDRLRSRDNLFGTLSAGALLGESAMIERRPSSHTYRAASFVRALQLPVGLYVEILRRTGQLDWVRRSLEMRGALMSSPLFDDCLPVKVLQQIVGSAVERHFAADERISGKDLGLINVIKSGTAERTLRNGSVNLLGPGSYFGEDSAIFNFPSLFKLRALEQTIAIQFPGELIADVPALRWKSFESFQERLAI